MSNKEELQDEARRTEEAASRSRSPRKRGLLLAFANFYRGLSRVEPTVSDNPNSPPRGQDSNDRKL